jgi:CheY-like chemotaxis protein
MDGHELAQRIRAADKSIPLIGMSSIGDHDTKNLFEYYMSKPIKELTLFNSIVKILTPPVVVEDKLLLQKSNENVDNSAKNNIKILVAEDQYVGQQVINGYLNKLGYKNFVIVENGQLVLDELEKTKYDILLLDLKMPVMDGLTTAKEIHKRFSADRKPVIIALTASALKSERDYYMKEGKMSGYVTKPIELSELRKALSELRF